MLAAARKYKRTVQVGLERRSTQHILEARDRYIKSGKLGKIASVDIHSYYGSGRSFPAQTQPPSTLDWEMYVGPATWRDYNPGITPRNWGQNPEPDYPWGVTYYGEKGTLKLSVWSYDYIPKDGGSPEKAKAVEER